MTASTMSATPVRPPYDPELGAVLASSPLPVVITADMIGSLREVPFTAPIEEVLSTRALDHDVVTVPGPDGDLAASVFTPRGKTTTGAGIYFLHGGGFILGDRFTGIEHILDWALESRVRGQKRLETPDLAVTYQPPSDSGYLRGDWRSPA